MARGVARLGGLLDARPREAATRPGERRPRHLLGSVYWGVLRVFVTATTDAPNDEDLSSRFLDLALQYHVAGRSAYFAFSMPIAGNLLHHAIEMLLKGIPAGVTRFR